MRLLGLAKGVSGYGKVRDGLALLSADRTARGKFMRVIRGVESESEVRELNLAVAGNNKNCGFWLRLDGKMGKCGWTIIRGMGMLGGMLMSKKVGLCRGVTQGGKNNGDDDMACVRETERFPRFAVARDETNKEAVSDVSLRSAWGT